MVKHRLPLLARKDNLRSTHWSVSSADAQTLDIAENIVKNSDHLYQVFIMFRNGSGILGK